MKINAISGWSTRLHAACMNAACAFALALAMPTAHAQDTTAAPTAVEAPASAPDAAAAPTDAAATAVGVVAGVLCLWGVSGLKRLLRVDDSLDVFGVHGVGGITGALLTGVFASPALGGAGLWDYVTETALPEYSIASQVWIQLQGVLVTVVLSGVVALLAFLVVKVTVGLRVAEDAEREGLDVTSHGEAAYEA